MIWRGLFIATVAVLAAFVGFNYAKSQSTCKCDPCLCSPDKSCHHPDPRHIHPVMKPGDNAKRVEDVRKDYVTLFYDKDWKNDKKCVTIYNALKADPRVSKTHFNVYTPDNLLYKARWDDRVKTFPTLVIQDTSGRITYGPYSGKKFPDSKQELTNCLFWWKKVTPKPDPKPEPDDEVEPDQEDEDEEEAQADNEGLPLWLIALLSLGGVAAGAGWKWYEDSRVA